MDFLTDSIEQTLLEQMSCQERMFKTEYKEQMLSETREVLRDFYTRSQADLHQLIKDYQLDLTIKHLTKDSFQHNCSKVRQSPHLSHRNYIKHYAIKDIICFSTIFGVLLLSFCFHFIAKIVYVDIWWVVANVLLLTLQKEVQLSKVSMHLLIWTICSFKDIFRLNKNEKKHTYLSEVFGLIYWVCKLDERPIVV